MALLKYFKRKGSLDCNDRDRGKDFPLPDPEGPLSSGIARDAIREANKEILERRTRSPYLKATSEQKLIVGKYASENGVVSAIRRYQKDFDGSLKESTVRGWRDTYTLELKARKRAGKDIDIKTLPAKKVGRPPLLDEEIDKEVQKYLLMLREAGGAVNGAIARSAAAGIIRIRNSKLLACNGGPIVLTKHWSRYLLERMGFVKRKANAKAKVTMNNLAKLKANFLADIKAIVQMEEVPACLVINWDHTAIKYVPVGCWTMAKEGSKKVPLADVEDKRQITAVFGATLHGCFLGQLSSTFKKFFCHM